MTIVTDADMIGEWNKEDEIAKLLTDSSIYEKYALRKFPVEKKKLNDW